MAFNRLQATKLMTVAELDVFEASRAETLRGLTPVQLRAKIRRARTLRDKYLDVLRGQRIATRGRTGFKSGADGNANERTAKKAAAFEEVLHRLEKRHAQLEAAEARASAREAADRARLMLAGKKEATQAMAAARTPTVSPKAPSKGPQHGGLDPGAASVNARGRRHAMKMKEAGNQAIQSHVSSQVRRSQAKRDSRSR